MKTKTIGTLLIAGLIVLSAVVAPAVAKPGPHGPPGHGNKNVLNANFDYTIGTPMLTDLHPDFGDKNLDAGDIEIYDDGSYLYITTTIDPNVKPYLAWHEDKGSDATEKSKIKSEKEIVILNDDKKNKYEWKVNGHGPKQASEITVPESSYFTGPIVYAAKIPIPSGYAVGDDVTIDIEIHASPNTGQVGQVPIPEFSTIVIPVAAILGLLFIFSRRRKRAE